MRSSAVLMIGAIAFGCANGTSILPHAPAAVTSTPALSGPPPSRREGTVDRIADISIPDPYRWLEDARGADVTRWLDGQDAYARRRLDALADHRFFVERIKALMSVGDVEVTVACGGRQFFRRRGAGEDKAQLLVRDSHGGERVLVNPAAWPPDDHIAFQNYWPSRDGRFVAIQVSKNNSDDSAVEVRDVETSKIIEVIQGARYDTIYWSGDGRGIYYTWYPPGAEAALARSEVRYHVIGRGAAGEKLLSPATGLSTVYQYVVRRAMALAPQIGWSGED